MLLSLWASLLWLLDLVPHLPQSPYYFGLVPLDGGLPAALIGGALGRALGIEPTVALMLVANLSLGLGLVFLFRLVELEFGDSVSRGPS